MMKNAIRSEVRRKQMTVRSKWKPTNSINKETKTTEKSLNSGQENIFNCFMFYRD